MNINDDILWKIDSEIEKDKKVVELRRKIEDLTNSNNFYKRKCSEIGIALKTYEEGRYQEHLEIERLNNIIDKAVEYINKNILISFDKVGYKTDTIAGIVVDELLEILDKERE